MNDVISRLRERFSDVSLAHFEELYRLISRFPIDAGDEARVRLVTLFRMVGDFAAREGKLELAERCCAAAQQLQGDFRAGVRVEWRLLVIEVERVKRRKLRHAKFAAKKSHSCSPIEPYR